ncbi:kynureninase-like [Styela clava]
MASCIFDDDLKGKNEKLELERISNEADMSITSENFSKFLDEKHPLSFLREEFIFPLIKYNENADSSLVNVDEKCIYMCGNSLGLQPKRTVELSQQVLDMMAQDEILSGEKCYTKPDPDMMSQMAKIVGANVDEIAVMNGLTVNLHLLLVSFYRPTAKRHKILIESKAFPSDHYMAESQIQYHGFDPKTSLITLEPRPEEDTLRPEDIIDYIEKEGESIAVILFPGVQYYTGQLFDMESITNAGHAKGCWVGFDLAHAVGNVEIHLHNWNVDFAAWCTYKYLNSGPGCIAGAFVHEKHKNNNFPKFMGPYQGANSTVISDYEISSPCPLMMASVRASMEVFAKTTIKKLRNKSFFLTGLLKYLIQHFFPMSNKELNLPTVSIITPDNFQEHGAQLSLVFSVPLIEIHKEMTKRGVVCDVRKPNVIRIAPTPLYCTFHDVFRFVEVLRESFQAASSIIIRK